MNKKQLLQDEYIIYKLKPSWKIWIGPAGLFLIILFALFSKNAENEEMIVFFMCFLLLLISFVFTFLIVLSESLKFLILTNKRVIIKNSYEEIAINLEEINETDMFRLTIIPRAPVWRYSIQFICKENKKIIRHFINISEEDYEKFKKLLVEECKKHGNNIS